MATSLISKNENKSPVIPAQLMTEQRFCFFGKKVFIDNVSKLRFAFIAMGLISPIGLEIGAIGYTSSHHLLPKLLAPLDRFKLLDLQWSSELVDVSCGSIALKTINIVRLSIKKFHYFREQSRQFSTVSTLKNIGFDKICKIENQIPKLNPSFEDLAKTKDKIHTTLVLIDSLKKELSLEHVELKSVEKLKEFLNSEDAKKHWKFRNAPIKRMLLEDYDFLFIELVEKFENFIDLERIELLNGLIKKYSSVFKTKLTDEEIQTLQFQHHLGLNVKLTKHGIEEKLEKNLKIEADTHWFYFPRINFLQGPNELETFENLDHYFLLLKNGLSKEEVYDFDSGITFVSDQKYNNLTGASEKNENEEVKTGEIYESFSILMRFLAQEYKIHLMPKPEFVLATVQKILELLNSNPSIRECIAGLKVNRNTTIVKYEGMSAPLIVIYPKFGKENAQKALNGLVKELHPYFEEWGSGEVPRLNCQGKNKNPLIFYAQGDAKQKITLKKEKPEIFKKMFESSGVHYHPDYGQFPLEHPEHF